MIKPRDPFDELGFLLRNETATSLGLAGKKLEKALQALAAFDASGGRPQRSVGRRHLVDSAADALQGLLVQKELNGIADHHTLNRVYSIPAEVWLSLGYSGAPE